MGYCWTDFDFVTLIGFNSRENLLAFGLFHNVTVREKQ